MEARDRQTDRIIIILLGEQRRLRGPTDLTVHICLLFIIRFKHTYTKVVSGNRCHMIILLMTLKIFF